MQAILRAISSHDLLAVAVLGGEAVSSRVEHELDLRAAGMLVSRILKDAGKADGQAARQFADAPVAA
jgi:hypothetical protein